MNILIGLNNIRSTALYFLLGLIDRNSIKRRIPLQRSNLAWQKSQPILGCQPPAMMSVTKVERKGPQRV